MNAVFQVASSTVRRSVRDRTFLLLGLVAPFLIMAALSATIGNALAGEYRPSLVIVDETNESMGDEIAAGLLTSGFDDVTLTNSESAARSSIEDGGAEAAIVIPRELFTSASPAPVRVIADAESEIATDIARSIAEQLASSATTGRLVVEVGASADDLGGPLMIRTADAVGSSVLTDATYFAVGMSSYFAFFACTLFMASYHQERKQSTLARMLLAPINRLTPIIGKGLGIALLTLISYAVLVIASSTLLDADWGSIPGVAVTVLALSFTAVAVAAAVVTLTESEEAASQVGIVLATGWAIFGGVFVEIPSSGPLATGARLSPFTWATRGIGYNAGTGTAGEVLTQAAGIAVFGVVAVIIVILGRQRLVAP